MKKQIISLFACSAFAACGGGGGGGGTSAPAVQTPPPPPPNASAGGIWEGFDSDGLAMIGLVTESGELHFIREDLVQYVGTAVTNVNALTVNYTGFADFGGEFEDGSTHGSGTLTGTVQERNRISGTATFTTAGGTQTTEPVTFTYNPLYDRDSSLSTIAGNFTDGADVLNIASNGVLFMQISGTGCVMNGTVGILNGNFNAYRVAFTFSSCQGEFAQLNGVQFSGLATLDNTSLPEVLFLGVTTQANGSALALAVLMERT